VSQFVSAVVSPQHGLQRQHDNSTEGYGPSWKNYKKGRGGKKVTLGQGKRVGESRRKREKMELNLSHKKQGRELYISKVMLY